MAQAAKKRTARPRQHQAPPGKQSRMEPAPRTVRDHLSQRLKGKRALITGGDSGIGRAVAVAFAQEGCDVAIAYDQETGDARQALQLVEAQGGKCILIKGDLTTPSARTKCIRQTVKELGGLDILVNNAAMQRPQEHFTDISEKQLRLTFATNFFAPFLLAQAAVKVMKKGACIINTASVTAYRGSPELIDYSSTKGAMVAFTRSLSGALIKAGIRVNAVAPGPIWTPLIASTFKAKDVATFGTDAPMKRAGQPAEVAPAYVFLASDDASYITGQVIHPNGGEIVNG
jgi:NAD(P)-dependent dehydrogenase (short-subunit alcohol dehydrogenase family)